jgi:hypothetical protein
MAKEMSVSVKSATNMARYVLYGLSATTAIFIAAAYFASAGSGLLWTVALIFATAGIYVYNRYVCSEYYYTITDGARPTLTVDMRVGKTVRTQARVDISSITEVKLMSAEEVRKYKCERGVVRYSYFPTMRPSSLLLISVRSVHEDADIFIEADGEFAEALSADSI